MVEFMGRPDDSNETEEVEKVNSEQEGDENVADMGSELDVEGIQDPPSPAPSYAPTSAMAQSDGQVSESGEPDRPDQASPSNDHGNGDQEHGEEAPQPQFQRLRHISSSSNAGDDTLLNLMEEMKSRENEISKLIEEDKFMLQKVLLGVDITEIYSRPRVVQMGMSMGLIAGYSFDLRTGWDLSSRENQTRVFQMIQASDPTMVIGSPPCTKFGCMAAMLNMSLSTFDLS